MLKTDSDWETPDALPKSEVMVTDAMVWNEYRRIVHEFDAILKHGRVVSASLVGHKPEHKYLLYAEQIFVKLLAHCISLRRLAPDPQLRTPEELWDLGSTSAVSRCIIEAYGAFAYIIAPNGRQDETDFRLDLWERHDKIRRLKMIKHVGLQDPRNAQIQAESDRLFSAIKASQTFRALDQKHQTDIEKEAPNFHLNWRERCAESKIDADFYNTITMDLSQHVHTHPYSIRQAFGFSAGSEKSLRLMKQPIHFALLFLARAVDEMQLLFQHLTPHPSDEVSQYIKFAKAITHHGFGSSS